MQRSYSSKKKRQRGSPTNSKRFDPSHFSALCLQFLLMQKLYNLCQQQFWLLAMRLAKERRYNDLHKDFRGKFLKEIRQSFLSASARKVSRRACTEVQVTQFGRSQSQPDEGACPNFGTATSHCAHNVFSSFS